MIVDPQGRRDTVEVVLEDKGDSIFRCTYRPILEGPHTIYVTFAGAQIPKSPFTVNVAEGKFASPNTVLPGAFSGNPSLLPPPHLFSSPFKFPFLST